jgi:putative thioredoxin
MTNIVDITLENAQQVLIEHSKEKLVVIDFWADWCEPCKQLMPILEKFADEFSETIILAKVNCDEMQQIAMQFRVQSMPTVVLMKDGQPVDGFTGVQPESVIRELIKKYTPAEEQAWVEQANAMMADQNFADAYPLLQKACAGQPENFEYLFLLINCLLELGKGTDAEQLLSNIPLAHQDSNYSMLISKLDLLKEAAESPEIKALESELQSDLDNLSIKVQLAVAYNQAQRNEEALTLLFEVLNKDLGFGDAKKTFLDIVASLPNGDPLASMFRKKLYTLLY